MSAGVNSGNRSSIPLIPRQYRFTDDARIERIRFLKQVTGCNLSEVEKTSLNSESLRGINGNTIGSVEIPVGIAGPLLFRGKRTEDVIYAPLATSEGALLESVTRGSIAITRSGGMTSCALEQRMMRVPVFKFSSIDQAISFSNWVGENEPEIKSVAHIATSHGICISITPRISGRLVHLEFLYTTGDAAGQNISTACTALACEWIKNSLSETGIELIAFNLEGNMSSDKKVSFNSYINGRGIRVVAETVLRKEMLKTVLNVTPDTMLSGYLRGLHGSVEAGMVGHNINVANVITGIFAATGQDIACAHESSTANLFLEKEGNDIYVSLTLPGLIVGTVGGGTGLPAQNQLLNMLGCDGDGKVFRFAEIIAGFCLALDVSTMSAMVSDVFASAHARLGRRNGRKISWKDRGK